MGGGSLSIVTSGDGNTRIGLTYAVVTASATIGVATESIDDLGRSKNLAEGAAGGTSGCTDAALQRVNGGTGDELTAGRVKVQSSVESWSGVDHEGLAVDSSLELNATGLTAGSGRNASGAAVGTTAKSVVDHGVDSGDGKVRRKEGGEGTGGAWHKERIAEQRGASRVGISGNSNGVAGDGWRWSGSSRG